eukprot:1268263-Pleurochrysis_carterae.AAC.2
MLSKECSSEGAMRGVLTDAECYGNCFAGGARAATSHNLYETLYAARTIKASDARLDERRILASAPLSAALSFVASRRTL